jgi:hypothetical protein
MMLHQVRDVETTLPIHKVDMFLLTGSNPGCSTNGFPAKAGWDPVTGLGTPNFAKLKAAVGL